MKIQDWLRQKQISFEVIEHPPGIELARLAEAGNLSRSELAGVRLLSADHGFRYMLAISALEQPLDLKHAVRALEGCELKEASEAERGMFCPDCEEGRLLPFGSHYNVRALLDQQLAGENSIVFAEIDGAAAIRLKLADYRAVENPLVVPLGKGEYR